MEKSQTKEQWEETFITYLVRLRDHFLSLSSQELVKPRSVKAVEGLIAGYFSERRNRIPVPYCSHLMDNETIAEYINDKVLSYIFDETNLLELDWRQMYILKSEEADLFNDSEFE